MTTRVIQWATGAVGSAQLRSVIDDPALQLVGVFTYSPEKVGQDAGKLVGRPRTGVLATNDKSAVLALEADLVLHAASKAYPTNTNEGDIVALLESGKSVITTTSYNHLPTFGTGLHARVKDACHRSGARFHAAGEHPGFMFERLATTITALSERVDRITVREFVDCRQVSSKEMLVDLMGMGKQPAEISADSAMFRAVSVQYEQSLAATADVLGLRIDEIRRSVQTRTSPEDIALHCATLPAGTVVGQLLCWTAYRNGLPLLIAEEYWTVTGVPEWDVPLDGEFLVQVIVEGAPPLRLELRIGNGSVDGLPGVGGGQLGVAMTAIRAIPDVLAAPAGVVTAPVFGAYRWPETPTSESQKRESILWR
jgi:2,4-diaminopentanoate dehydrogenase